MRCQRISRRELLRSLGISSAALPWIGMLPSLGFARQSLRKRRIVIVFSPNGVVPESFWPKEPGENAEFPAILKPLEPFRDQTLILDGVDNRVGGDGDDHMRGMSCLLTAIELFPGNIQGGGNTPAGWPRGLSIDQEIANFLQSGPATQTRFGSLEFGVLVPNRADVWTRMVYTGPNRPVAPISDPYRMFKKLYSGSADQELLTGVMDSVVEDLHSVRKVISAEDRHLLDDHLEWVAQTEKRIATQRDDRSIETPTLNFDIGRDEAAMPRLSELQQDLLVSSFRNDLARIATLQYTNSVGNARMKFLGIEEGHHELSHDPDQKTESVEKLVKINTWYCQQISDLAQRLADTPEPDGNGTLLDNTTIIWTNELGKGNNHTLNGIPFVLVGGGCGFRMGRTLKFDHLPHNRLWISLAHSMGHEIATFGNPRLSRGGVVEELF